MLAESRFEPARGSFGLEIELNLTGDNGTPAMANAAVVDAIADPDFQTELYNDHGDVAEFILHECGRRLLGARRRRRIA